MTTYSGYCTEAIERSRQAACGSGHKGAAAGRFLCLVAALFAAVAGYSSSARAQIVATDILGRQITLDEPASRIAIDDGRYLIALSLIHPDPVSLLSAWPHDVKRIGPAVYEQYRRKNPAIGDLPAISSSTGNLSVEEVLAAAPDLAVFSLAARPSAEQIALLESAGLAVAVIDFFNQPEVNLEPSLRFLGRVTGRDAQAEDFISFRRDHLQAISSALAGDDGPRPRVFLEPHAARTDDCCASPGKGNIGNYIDFVGGDNIGADVIPGPAGMLSLEYVIEANPDVYIVTGGSHMEGTVGLLIGPEYNETTIRDTLRRVADRNGISGLRATRSGRVHGIAHQLLNSPLDILATEALAKWIRPDLFADIDLEETKRQINDRFLAIPLDGINWIDLE